MDKIHKQTHFKSEFTDLTSTCKLEIPNKMKIDSIKDHNDGLVHSEIIIKMEPHEDESDFRVTPVNSSEICPGYDVKYETDELKIKTEHEELCDEPMQDPLDVGSDIKEENDDHLSEPRSDIGKTEDKGLANKNLARNKKIEFACDVCNKSFKNRYNFNNHLRIHTGEKPFSCDICQQSFSRKGTLDDHMILHTGKKRHECNICKESFKYRADLSKHKWVHSSVKPYTCNECNRSFVLKQHYVEHQRVHTDARPYACDVCDKAFKQKSNLTIHRRIHTGEKPYMCDICEKSFVRISDLKVHKKNHKN